MFKSSSSSAAAKKLPSYTDFTKSLGEQSFYKVGTPYGGELGLGGEVTAVGVDPVGGWMAVGTSCGSIHLVGSAPVSLILSVYKNPPRPAATGNNPVKFIVFHPGHGRLIAIDGQNTVHVWDLNSIDPRLKLPHKDAANSLFGTVTAVDLPSPSTSHLLVTLKDGTTLFLDLARKCNLSPYRIPNVWSMHEDRLRRSGMPAPKRLGPPMATAIAVNPRDLNQVLVGYEGGVIIWNIQTAATERTYEFTLPPGAPGGGTYQDENLFTERSPSVTCVSWKPDGLVFAVGYDDGCIAVWAVEDSDKPLSVRTVALEDVNVTDAESLFESGILAPVTEMNLPGDGNGLPSAFAGREPIFKLVWAAYPDPPALKALIAAQGTEAAGEPLSTESREYAERGETTLVVLGGLLSTDPMGITVLQFPAFKPPTANIAPPRSPGGHTTMSQAVRSAFRDSLSITGSTLYPTPTPCEDFFLLPRTNPHFSLAFDPIAIITLLGADRSLPRVTGGPFSARGLKAHTFPPVRSDQAPLSPGRKEFLSPGNEEAFVPISAAPLALSPTARNMPLPKSPSSPWGGWGQQTPTSPKAPMSPSAVNQPKMGREGFGEYRMPFWAGGEAVLGCEVISPEMDAFRRAIGWSIEKGDEVPRLPLRGGAAYPDLETHGAPDLRSAKLEKHRLLVTWHLGGTVQFYDFSPHLLVLPPTGLRFEYPAPLPHLNVDIRALLRDESIFHHPAAKLLASNPDQIEIQSVHVASDTLEMAVVLVTGQIFYFKFGEAKPGYEDENDRFRFPSQTSDYDKPAEEITPLGHLAKWATDGFKPVLLLDVKQGQVQKCAVSDTGFLAVSFAQKSLCVLDLRGPDIMLREGFAEEGEKSKKGEGSVAMTLRWSVCAIGTDPTVGVRFFVGYQKGLNKIYSFVHGLAGWEVAKKPITFTHESLVNPLASFVVDAENGEELTPNATRLQAAMKASDALQRAQTGTVPPTAASHSVWISSSRRALRSQMNINGDRLGKVELDEDLRAVYLVTRHSHKVLIALAESGTAYAYSVPALDLVLRLPLHSPLGTVSMDTSSGDYLTQTHPGSSVLTSTLFDHRKALPPNVVLTTLARPIPYQPLPLQSSVLASWLGTWGGGALTGAQVDAIVAGPNRPAAVAKPVFPPPKSHVVERPPLVTRVSPTRGKTVTREEIDKRARKDAYTEMTDAAAERGNMLDGLSETLGRMGTQAGEMATQAKRIAQKETAKSTARSFFRF